MLQLKINNNLNIGDFNLSINCLLDFSNGIVGVCGPSGSGKTLFLRVIAGLEKESEGIVHFNKIIFQDDSKKIFMNTSQRNAVMVFQENRLFSNLKVKDNILFGYRRRKREITIQFDKIVETLNIKHLFQRNVLDLSGGERQRVAIARGLLADKDILLLDEPFSAQDIEMKNEIISLIKEISVLHKVPILVVTHSSDDLIKLTNKTILINSGRIKIIDDTKEVVSKYIFNKYAIEKEPSNLIEGTIKNHDKSNGLTNINFGNFSLSVPILNRKNGSQVLVKILNKDIIISRTKLEGISIRNLVKAIITSFENVNNTYVDISCLVGETKITSRITHLSFKELKLKEKDKIYLLIKSTMVEKIL